MNAAVEAPASTERPEDPSRSTDEAGDAGRVDGDHDDTSAEDYDDTSIEACASA